MKTDNNLESYPYLQVIILFAGMGSMIGGLIAELVLLLVFRGANFDQIGYQPLLHVSFFGFVPALLTGIIVAYKNLRRSDYKSIVMIFLIGFMVSAFYTGSIVLYLGISSWLEVVVLLAFMFIVGLFGAVNSVIAGGIALPKVCKSGFDIASKKEDDSYTRIVVKD